MPIAVLDSSVLVPFWSRTILQKLAVSESASFIPVWSEWIVAETWRVLAWRRLVSGPAITRGAWLQLTDSANEMMRFLLPVMRHASLHRYSGPEPWPSMSDVNDIPVWDTATSAGAHYVVSHNTRDFPPLVNGRHIWQGVEYLTAIEFIEDILGVDVRLLTPSPPTPAMLVRSRRER